MKKVQRTVNKRISALTKMSHNDGYPPAYVGFPEFITNLAWAASNGAELECIKPGEVVGIDHPKSACGYECHINRAESRLRASKIILNWVNGEFPDLESGKRVDWP